MFQGNLRDILQEREGASFNKFWIILNFSELFHWYISRYFKTSGYTWLNRLYWTILSYLRKSLAIFGNLWISLAISGYLSLYLIIVGYLLLSLTIYGYIWLYLAISGYFWVSLGISGHLRQYQAVSGYLWQSLAISIKYQV